MAYITPLAATHEADTSDAHDASAVSILDTAGDFTATDVEGALAELQSDAEAHLTDSSDAHDASAISITDSGGYFTGTDVEAALQELGAASGGGGVMPVLFGTESVISLGGEIAASGATRDTSVAWPAADRRIYVPITITEDCTVVKVWWVNGGTVSGNVDFTLYTEALAKTAITSGSTAQSGTTVIQEVNTADTALTAGRYYMSIALDNATGRISGYAPAIETVKSWGVAQEASAFTAPATATLAAAATAFVPTIGMSLRTLVA